MENEYPVKAAAEIATDENGEVLWVERYIFSRIHGRLISIRLWPNRCRSSLVLFRWFIPKRYHVSRFYVLIGYLVSQVHDSQIHYSFLLASDPRKCYTNGDGPRGIG
jgi:hypothetical protein